MWKQMLFWAALGPKHLRGFLLLWLVLMGIVFYALVQDAFDGSSKMSHAWHPPMSAPLHR